MLMYYYIMFYYVKVLLHNTLAHISHLKILKNAEKQNTFYYSR